MRTVNMLSMFVTLDELKLSGWLKLDVICRVKRRTYEIQGERCGPREQRRRGPREQGRWGGGRRKGRKQRARRGRPEVGGKHGGGRT